MAARQCCYDRHAAITPRTLSLDRRLVLDINEPVHFLPLLDGVVRWCDQDLIAKIIETEKVFSFVALEVGSWPQLSHEKDRRFNDYGLRDLQSSMFRAREAYWPALERDLRSRLAGERLHLEVVLVKKEMNEAAQAIRGAFASEFQFNFRENTLRFKQQKFVSVTVSLTPSPWAPLEIGRVQPTITARSFKAADLTGDEIVELIEEHARRVIADPDAKLAAPGKVSLIPLIQMKMTERNRRKEMNDTLAGEAAWLAGWIASKTEHWDPPKAATIEKTLRITYATLKGRSSAAT